MTLAHARQAAISAASASFRADRSWSWPPRAAARWLARRTKTAQATAAGMPIRHGERVLTLDRSPAGALVAATAAAVYARGQAEPGSCWCRLGWEDVIRVGWDDQRCTLSLLGAGPGGMWRKDLALDRHTALVELARERVRSTLLASVLIREGDRVAAVVTARRQPGSGQVVWITLLSPAGAADNHAIRARAAAVIADLRAQTGIPAA